ncbi:Aste57867_4037 [Aphanomyces stellatus]|uniref:Aste57867_4037 protein n=1 Tax=Aphanomyces stellatus TaxID=120398 RepID=A0A485KAT5_9STRA|nr:hypothetical protein As57867_004026 [Aphanomyces stellatus]VFT81172.1 Aste57867_4037 [Aphanomyces stellatus]
MDEVFKAVESYIDDGATALEHKLLESHGGPSMTSTQAEEIHEGVNKYMDTVRSAFVKNFDKFELYIGRNVFVAPDNIAEMQQTLQAHQDAQEADLGQWQDADPVQVEVELHALRREIVAATHQHAALRTTKADLDHQIASINQLVVDLNFTQDIPRTVGPLGQHVESAVALRTAIGSMRELQSHLDTKKVDMAPKHHPLTYDAIASRFNKQPLQGPMEDLVHVNLLFRS